MDFSRLPLFFILLLLFSSLLANSFIPSFAVQPIPTTCGDCTPLAQYKMSPLQQFKIGIPLPNIICKLGLVLVFKISDGSPSCMKSETAQKLFERGWGVPNDQTVWFEYDAKECQQTPWDEFFAHISTQLDKEGIIKDYFKRQGITILDAEQDLTLPNMTPVTLCGSSSGIVFYFLVPESDINKITTLGYKQVDNIPSWTHHIGQP